MSDAAVAFPADIKDLGEKIVGLTLLQAKSLSDYLEQVHGIKAAAGGVMMAAPAAGAGAGAAAEAEAPKAKTEFDVILDAPGGNKIQVIKVVREATGLGLKEAKDLVDGAPKPIKNALPKEEAEALKKKLEDAGATVSIK